MGIAIATGNTPTPFSTESMEGDDGTGGADGTGGKCADDLPITHSMSSSSPSSSTCSPSISIGESVLLNVFQAFHSFLHGLHITNIHPPIINNRKEPPTVVPTIRPILEEGSSINPLETGDGVGDPGQE